MEGQVYRCSQCLYVFKDGEIDLKTKRAVCPKCDSLVVLSRKEINASKVVTHDIENAISFFEKENFDDAHDAAKRALAIADDNAVALFVIAYYNAFQAKVKSRSELIRFFNEELPEIDVLEDEMEGLKKLILICGPVLEEFEYEILSKMNDTLSDEDLLAFTEAFCPKVIMGKGSIDWFTPKMKEIYTEITKKGTVYNTWKALYAQISKNPDSPELQNNFFLKTKAQRFFDDYLCGVESIFANIQDEALKTKFGSATLKKKQSFREKM